MGIRMKLTDVNFWEQYWAGVQLPSEVDWALSSDRCLAEALNQHLQAQGGTAFEVGCAPGKWLAFMAREFGMAPSGIEYTEAGMKATLRNFSQLGLSPDEIVTGDFFSTEPTRQFDTVMSFGFIEHFDDPEAVVERHLRWLKPGGRLVLGVPNFTGIYKLIQAILDQTLLDKHNLSIMNTAYFEALGKKLRLEQDFIGYIGSFEPSLPIARPGYGSLAQNLLKIGIRLAVPLRRLRFFDRVNHPAISSYILAIYRKSDRE
jgi:SAM-dependent methyltransferase